MELHSDNLELLRNEVHDILCCRSDKDINILFIMFIEY